MRKLCEYHARNETERRVLKASFYKLLRGRMCKCVGVVQNGCFEVVATLPAGDCVYYGYMSMSAEHFYAGVARDTLGTAKASLIGAA